MSNEKETEADDTNHDARPEDEAADFVPIPEPKPELADAGLPRAPEDLGRRFLREATQQGRPRAHTADAAGAEVLDVEAIATLADEDVLDEPEDPTEGDPEARADQPARVVKEASLFDAAGESNR